MAELFRTPIPYMLTLLWVVSQVVEARGGHWMTAAIIAWSGIGVVAFIASLVAAYKAGARP